MRVAFVPARGDELGERGQGLVDRVARALGIGHVALHAAHRELGAERAAPAHLDHVADAMRARGFADHAPADLFAALAQPVDHAPRAVDRGAFLVAGEQEGDAPLRRLRGQQPFAGRDHRRQAALHVGRPAAVQHAVGDPRLERRMRPRRQRSGRHHVGVAREHEQRSLAAAHGPEVVDLAVAQVRARKAHGLQARGEQLLAAGIVGRHRGAADQLGGERQRRGGPGGPGHVQLCACSASFSAIAARLLQALDRAALRVAAEQHVGAAAQFARRDHLHDRRRPRRSP